jgi:hypothetical protein
MAKTDRQKERYEERKQYILEFKNQPCADCGNHYPPVCMDFHHINEDLKPDSLKGYNKSSITRTMRVWSIKKINEEMNNMVVLCANCHRIRHDK